MAILGGWEFLMSEVPLYRQPASPDPLYHWTCMNMTRGTYKLVTIWHAVGTLDFTRSNCKNQWLQCTTYQAALIHFWSQLPPKSAKWTFATAPLLHELRLPPRRLPACIHTHTLTHTHSHTNTHTHTHSLTLTLTLTPALTLTLILTLTLK